MAADAIRGNFFDASPSSVEFFGAKGRHWTPGKTWAINMETEGEAKDVMVEVSPAPILPDILQVITTDEAAGDGDKIAQLVVGPRQAVVLYLEGCLTYEDMRRATESEAEVVIPGVKIGERTLTVRVLEEPEYNFYTADKDGVIV